MKELIENGFMLFVVSNQPDHAKGKTSLELLTAVHERFAELLIEENIHVNDFYYCFHHPKGIVDEYSFECECRKPKPFFVNKAILENDIDRSASWFVGDRESDILCGRLAGLRTVFIRTGQESPGKENGGNFQADDLLEAANLIIKQNSSIYAGN
jgi:D-glycero-D-manno-heptose 1,7-bisphosphate phosphatase